LGYWLGGVEEVPAERGQDAVFREILPGVLGGAVLSRALRPVATAASSTIPILLIGATGVGKERVAVAIHQSSGRRGPLHAVNCASVPASMAEAEFFGYARGAFTGAGQAHPGHVMAADKGTLFLDEVTDLPVGIQPLFLRVLDQCEVVPLGQTKAKPFDARIVAATHEPLTQLVEQGRFRPDLAARLSGLVVDLPSLAERRLDVPRLFRRLMTHHAAAGDTPAVSATLYERLCIHTWPGNVRELELLARQLLALHGHEPMLRRAHLPPGLAERTSQSQPPKVPDKDVDQAGSQERAELIRAIQEAGGNVRQAAQRLGISRHRAYRLLDPYTLRKLRNPKSH
jgi:transcriptional regulator with PAS, ATPase and Fis domain